MKKFISSTLTITIFLVLTSVFAYSETNSGQENLIPGSDKAEIIHCGEANTAYIYDDFVIYTRPSGDYEGSNIYIFNPLAQSNNPCEVDYKRATFTIRVGEFGGANKFYGAHDYIIFLDQWTGRNFKRLLGIDITTKSLVFLATYAEPEIKNDELIYYRTLKAKRKSVREKIPCPEASDWEADGKQVLYVEKISVDLNTMVKEPSGEFSCIPSEPIGSVKPRSYGH